MEYWDAEIEDFSNEPSFQIDDDTDFIELCGLFADNGDDFGHARKKARIVSSPSLDGSGSESKRRKKDGVPALAEASKIPRNDVRRSIPSTFKDAFNSCEKDKFPSLLRAHCSQSCSAVYKYVGPPNQFATADYTEIIGLDAVSAYWESLFNAVPDSLFDIVETKFRLLPNKHTSIVCKFLFSGTKVFKLCTDDKNAVVYASNVAQTMRASTSPVTTNSDLSEVFDAAAGFNASVGPPRVLIAELDAQNSSRVHSHTQRLFNLGSYLAQPKKVAVIGTLTFHIDPDNKIFRFEFIFSVKT